MTAPPMPLGRAVKDRDGARLQIVPVAVGEGWQAFHGIHLRRAAWKAGGQWLVWQWEPDGGVRAVDGPDKAWGFVNGGGDV